MPSIETWNELPGARRINVVECDGDIQLEVDDGEGWCVVAIPPSKARRLAEEILKLADKIEGK